MVDKITEYAKQWKAMPRNCESDILAADTFYDKNIMPLSAKRFLEQYGDKNKRYDLMFATIGTSWQPVALSIMVNKPHRVVFLATEFVEGEICKALDFLKSMGYFIAKYDVIIVDKSESRKLLISVRDAYVNSGVSKACFDITGGTKSMVAAAGMIAANLNMDIFYIENNYLPVYRHPEPGSERMVKLDRPQDI